MIAFHLFPPHCRRHMEIPVSRGKKRGGTRTYAYSLSPVLTPPFSQRLTSTHTITTIRYDRTLIIFMNFFI